MFLKKMTPNYLEKETFLAIMRKKKLTQNLYLKLRNIPPFFYQVIEIVVDCIRNKFQPKNLIETLQATGILLLKALPEEDFGHELQQMSSFFSNDLHKFKLETQSYFCKVIYALPVLIHTSCLRQLMCIGNFTMASVTNSVYSRFKNCHSVSRSK